MVGVVARRLSGVVEALQPLLMRGRGKECTLSCEVLPLLWIACGHGEDTAFVRLAEELQPLIRTSEEDVKAAEVRVCALVCCCESCRPQQPGC